MYLNNGFPVDYFLIAFETFFCVSNGVQEITLCVSLSVLIYIKRIFSFVVGASTF
jgi:hypothetical protein